MWRAPQILTTETFSARLTKNLDADEERGKSLGAEDRVGDQLSLTI